MQAQRALLNFTESERKLGDRLVGIAIEIDRIEGYSEPHAVVIAVLAEKLARRLGVHGTDMTALKYAALTHDLGERAMKRNYLLRPDAITSEELLDLWRHPILGEQSAADLGLPRHSQLLIRWHHEWWNGQGYPDGLSGESIPIGARILRLADTYYALRSNRPHRGPYSEAEAVQFITDRAGLEFDPMLVRLFLSIREEERTVRQPEVISPGVEAFTILTPQGLQTAFVSNQNVDDSIAAEEAPAVSTPGDDADGSTLDEAPAFEPVAPPPDDPGTDFLSADEPEDIADGQGESEPSDTPERNEG